MAGFKEQTILRTSRNGAHRDGIICRKMDIAHLIQTSVAPVFLLSGVAATLGVLTNRLARCVDRARSLEAGLENHTGDPEHILYDMEVLVRRARYLNTAISLCVVSAVMVALVVVTLFANAFFEVRLGLTIALLFVGAMLLLTGAFIAFFIEVRVATAALRIGLPRAGL
jgi:Protein of unknown function (DUF2721)